MAHIALDPFDTEPSDPTYLNSAEFREYGDAIRAFIAGADHPVTIREMHFALGEKARPRWTADVLDSSLSVESVGILPTRYRRRGSRLDKTPLDPLRRFPNNRF